MKDALTGVLPWLFLASCLTLGGLWVSFILVTRAQKQKDKRRARLSQIAQPQATQRQPVVSAFTSFSPVSQRSFFATCMAVVGIVPERLSELPIPWWVVVPLSLVLAKGTQVLLREMVGDLSYLAIPVLWVFLCRSVFGWMEKRRRQLAVLQLPDLLDQVVRGVRVGMPVMEAVRVAANGAAEPTRGEFMKLIDQVSVGAPLEEAVADMARRCSLPEYSFFATAVALQNQTGGALSDALGILSDVVRKRIAIAEKGKALSSEAKATVVVLTILPFGTGLIMWVMNPAYMSLLFLEPTGHKMLAGAALSLTLGLLTIRTMFQKALSLT